MLTIGVLATKNFVVLWGMLKGIPALLACLLAVMWPFLNSPN